MRTADFAPIHTILVPFIHDDRFVRPRCRTPIQCRDHPCWRRRRMPEDQSLSTGAAAARALRRTLRIYGKDKRIISKTQVIVSHHPWEELSNLIQDENPDLLCLEFDSHLKALRVTASDVLTRPPCDVALVRGKITSKPKQVLVPVRGGPHAELAVRVGLGLHPKGVASCTSADRTTEERMRHSNRSNGVIKFLKCRKSRGHRRCGASHFGLCQKSGCHHFGYDH